MKNTNSRSAFTLIEIMIVIVIISLLAVTLVPQLTSAQARSRDTSRAASLTSMKAVLLTYYDDNSQYPINTSGTSNGCLSGANWVTSVLEDYVDGWTSPMDPQAKAASWNCTTSWSFWYTPLSKNGTNHAAFILNAQAETYQKANAISTGTVWLGWGVDVDGLTGASSPKIKINQTVAQLKTADAAPATTIYTVIWK